MYKLFTILTAISAAIASIAVLIGNTHDPDVSGLSPGRLIPVGWIAAAALCMVFISQLVLIHLQRQSELESIRKETQAIELNEANQQLISRLNTKLVEAEQRLVDLKQNILAESIELRQIDRYDFYLIEGKSTVITFYDLKNTYDITLTLIGSKGMIISPDEDTYFAPSAVGPTKPRIAFDMNNPVWRKVIHSSYSVVGIRIELDPNGYDYEKARVLAEYIPSDSIEGLNLGWVTPPNPYK